MTENETPKNTCQETSCGCESKQGEKSPKSTLPNTKDNLTKKDLDPTHFGDWQVDCRAIDF